MSEESHVCKICGGPLYVMHLWCPGGHEERARGMSTFHDHNDAEMEQLLNEASTPEQLQALLERCTRLEFQRIDSHILADLVLAKLALIALGPLALETIEHYVRCVKEEWWYA